MKSSGQPVQSRQQVWQALSERPSPCNRSVGASDGAMATNKLKAGAPGGRRFNTVRPVRLQLSRAAGFNLQALSRDTNGLPAVNVARPGKWGNPYTIHNSGALHPAQMYACQVAPTLDTAPLRGKNLACWCKLGSPCHADILLKLANAE